jgi:hypothetical protein
VVREQPTAGNLPIYTKAVTQLPERIHNVRGQEE